MNKISFLQIFANKRVKGYAPTPDGTGGDQSPLRPLSPQEERALQRMVANVNLRPGTGGPCAGAGSGGAGGPNGFGNNEGFLGQFFGNGVPVVIGGIPGNISFAARPELNYAQAGGQFANPLGNPGQAQFDLTKNTAAWRVLGFTLGD